MLGLSSLKFSYSCVLLLQKCGGGELVLPWGEDRGWNNLKKENQVWMPAADSGRNWASGSLLPCHSNPPHGSGAWESRCAGLCTVAPCCMQDSVAQVRCLDGEQL